MRSSQVFFKIFILSVLKDLFALVIHVRCCIHRVLDIPRSSYVYIGLLEVSLLDHSCHSLSFFQSILYLVGGDWKRTHPSKFKVMLSQVFFLVLSSIENERTGGYLQ